MVTGGAGFIGSELVRQLAEDGSHILIVDNLTNGKRENVESVLGEAVELHVADIRGVDSMDELMRGVDLVYHLACLGVRHSIHAPRENHDVNASATLGLLELARKHGVERFVYVSSSEVYGTALWAPMTEEHPTFPMTVYGAGKLAGECYARAYHHTYDLPTVVVRPFNSFGPRCHHEGDSGEVIPKFMLRCLAGKPMIIFGDGSQTRDFTFVEDTARGVLLSGFSETAVGQTINLGQGREITIRNLAEEVSAVVGRGKADVVHRSPRPGDVMRLYADSTRAEALLGFSPRVPLKEGLEHLMRWYADSDRSPEDMLRDEVVQNWEVGGSG
ncbi:MAG: GDP-mannose 4,6-dehydratase [Gemmatimonadota bacterium]